MAYRIGWALLAFGAALFYMAFIGVLFAAHLYSVALAEGVLQL